VKFAEASSSLPPPVGHAPQRAVAYLVVIEFCFCRFVPSRLPRSKIVC
jgi:hypothetical protein